MSSGSELPPRITEAPVEDWDHALQVLDDWLKILPDEYHKDSLRSFGRAAIGLYDDIGWDLRGGHSQVGNGTYEQQYQQAFDVALALNSSAAVMMTQVVVLRAIELRTIINKWIRWKSFDSSSMDKPQS